jgi:hypothetical protein
VSHTQLKTTTTKGCRIFICYQKINLEYLYRYLYTLDKACVRTKTDQTLEIIMTDLDRERMKIFYQEYTNSAAEATKVCLM